MKTFLTSTFSAIVAGLIIFFAQGWWAQGQNGTKQKIRFDHIQTVELSKDDLTRLADKASKYENASIELWSVKNVGTEDIADKSFSMTDGSVWGFGTIQNPNGNPKSASLTYDGKVITINYKLLPEKSGASFWVASSSLSSSVGFSNDAPGIHVVSSIEKIEEENPFPWQWFAIVATALVIFIAGALIGNASTVHELNKRGYDYKDLISEKPEIKTDKLSE